MRPFYQALLPALGFTRDAGIEGWLQFEASDRDAVEFFGVTVSPGHLPKRGTEPLSGLRAWQRWIGCRRLQFVRARATFEGPAFETPDYYAVFLDDPCGNRLEVCYLANFHRDEG